MHDDELIARHIVPDPSKSGRHESRVREGGVSVWALVARLNATENDVSRVADEYGVLCEAVGAALA